MLFPSKNGTKTPVSGQRSITMRKIHTTRFLAVACLAAILATVAGCASGTPPDPTKRLALATNVYNTTEETLVGLSQQGLIPAADKPVIADAILAARAAINDAHTHINDGQTVFAAAVSQVEAAIIPLTNLVAKYQSAKGAK